MWAAAVTSEADLLDATIINKGKIELRGGRIRKDAGEWAEVSAEPIVAGRNAACQLVIDDPKVSAVHLEFVATSQGVRVRDLGSRNGTFVGGVRVGSIYLTAPSKIRVGDSTIEFDAGEPERVALPDMQTFGPMVAQSPSMRAIFQKLTKVAATDLTVLIGGETGTGKELVAQAIHMNSSRAKKPFVVVDCGSIPPTLAEAALFGHEKGAFTGAVDRRQSPFAEADGGTIFLDELGELPLDVQPKLLRALAERRIKAVGGNSYREVDVRVICATRRDLVRGVNNNAFRSDLYFRVAQVKVELPSLRQRLEDIPALVHKMLDDMGGKGVFERVTQETIERLMRHDWPGNVRELRNAVTVAFALAGDDDTIDIAAHLGTMSDTLNPGGIDHPSMPTSLRGRSFQDAKKEILARFERDYFDALYRDARGNVSEMARRAGMERAHVRTYLKRHAVGGRPGETDGDDEGDGGPNGQDGPVNAGNNG